MIERFAKRYELARSDVLLEIERSICGCDYGATSWTTLDEAREAARRLGLKPGKRLLEVGAGSGWPGLHLAKESGCDVALIDLPLSGLRIARERAEADQIESACWFAVADGAALPFADAWFDAVFQSDVLCCLPDKLAVLKSCRRVVRPDARMVFSVIYVSPDLSADEHERALASGPPFIESDVPYPELLRQAGWHLTWTKDMTADYLSTMRRLLEHEQDYNTELSAVLGTEEAQEILKRRHSSVAALEGGLIRRELFDVVPIETPD